MDDNGINVPLEKTSKFVNVFYANIGSKLAMAYNDMEGDFKPEDVLTDLNFENGDFSLRAVEEEEIRKYVNKINPKKFSGHNERQGP